MVEDAVAAATSVGLPGIALRGTVSSAMASHNAKEGTLGGTKTTSGTEIISGTGAISLLEIPFGMITPTTGMAIPTSAIMTKMRATIPRPLLPCRSSQLNSAIITVTSMA